MPKELRGNVNVSGHSPLKEFFILLCGIAGLMAIIYVALGFAVNIIVTRLPPETEQKIGKYFLLSLFNKVTKGSKEEKETQKLLDDLLKSVPVKASKDFTIHVVSDPVLNALALPGGNIIMFSGLLKEIKSENELAFVLAHELGHFANRDHLRGLGRGLVLLTLSAAIFGDEGSVSQFIMESLINLQMKFSQHQESLADIWAVDLLYKRYGHTAGATDFFKKIKAREKKGRLSYYFATHPYPEDRIQAIENHIRRKGYPAHKR